jgi:LysM repeat protein
MGLFSFLKGKGKKVFKTDPATTTPEKAEPLRASELLNYVKQLGLTYNKLIVKTSGDTVTLEGEVARQEDMEKIALALGNVEGVATVSNQMTIVEPQEQSKFHTVEKGDTLSKIAKQYYGDMMKYPAIFEANKPMLKDPDEIYPGQVLRIPAQ